MNLQMTKTHQKLTICNFDGTFVCRKIFVLLKDFVTINLKISESFKIVYLPTVPFSHFDYAGLSPNLTTVVNNHNKNILLSMTISGFAI